MRIFFIEFHSLVRDHHLIGPVHQIVYDCLPPGTVQIGPLDLPRALIVPVQPPVQCRKFVSKLILMSDVQSFSARFRKSTFLLSE